MFNIGRQFLMLPLTPEELRPRSPTLPHLIQAVAVLDHGFVPPHPALSRGRPLTPEGVADIITRSGLVLDEARTFEYDSPPEAQLAWLSVPVFAQNVLPGMPYDQQLGVLAKAYERFDKSSGAKGVRMAFVAHKPQPHGSHSLHLRSVGPPPGPREPHSSVRGRPSSVRTELPQENERASEKGA